MGHCGRPLSTPPDQAVAFEPSDSRRDASFTSTSPSAEATSLSQLVTSSAAAAAGSANALAVTRVEIRDMDTPDPPAGLVARGGNGQVTLSWATDTNADDYEYRQRRQPGSYGRWTAFAGDEFQRAVAVTSNTVTGLNGGT